MPGNLSRNIDVGNTPATDNGTRPYTSSTPLCENANVWRNGGVNHTQAQVNLPATVQVRVSNDAIIGVQIDAHVMNPSVSLSSPSLAEHPRGVPASVRVDLSEEHVGALHALDIVQRDTAGRPLGGPRVLAVATR